MKWFLSVLAGQSIILAAAGERLPLVINAVALLVLLAYVGMRPSRQQISMALALTMLTMIAITGYRAESGRTLYRENSGLNARVEALGSGFYGLVDTSNASDSGPGLIAQAAARLDGNAFVGGVVQGMHYGDPKPSAADVGESMLVVIPHFLWPSKLTYAALNPVLVQVQAFDSLIVVRGTTSAPLTTSLGMYLGFLGPFWLIVFLAIIGAIFGWFERWIFLRLTAVRIVVLAATLQGLLAYEAGLPALLCSLRTAVILIIALKMVELVRGPARSIGHDRKEIARWPWRPSPRPALGPTGQSAAAPQPAGARALEPPWRHDLTHRLSGVTRQADLAAERVGARRRQARARLPCWRVATG